MGIKKPPDYLTKSGGYKERTYDAVQYETITMPLEILNFYSILN